MGVMPRNLDLGRGEQSCVRDMHNESYWRAITMRTVRDLFVVSLILLTAIGSTPARDAAEIKSGGDFAVEVIPDVAYYSGPGADTNKNKLDLYLPKGQKDFPVIFFVHGGAWTSGERKMYTKLGRLLEKNGIGEVILYY